MHDALCVTSKSHDCVACHARRFKTPNELRYKRSRPLSASAVSGAVRPCDIASVGASFTTPNPPPPPMLACACEQLVHDGVSSRPRTHDGIGASFTTPIVRPHAPDPYPRRAKPWRARVWASPLTQRHRRANSGTPGRRLPWRRRRDAPLWMMMRCSQA